HNRAQTASTVGTPAYMAPEVWEGKVALHSDQYSLAVTYAEARLGRLPFPVGGLGQMIRCHLHLQPELDPLAEQEQQVLLRALAKSPEQRYPTCTEFVQALTEAIVPASQREFSAPAAPSKPARAAQGRPGAAAPTGKQTAFGTLTGGPAAY